MKLTEDYVRKVIEEVTPMVEEESQLETDLKDFGVKVTNNILYPLAYTFFLGEKSVKEALLLHYIVAGGYNLESNKFSFPKIKTQEDIFKKTVAHEVMHNAQFKSFKDLKDKYTSSKQNSLEAQKIDPLETLIEGDATLIENSFPEKIRNKFYFIPKVILNYIGEDYIENYINKRPRAIYQQGERILRKKFNNGKDRKSINELYTAPIEELVKIFGNQ